MALKNKQPGPSIVVYFDLFNDNNPALFSMKLLQTTLTNWYAEVYNRRTNVKLHTTTVYTSTFAKQEAIAEAREYMHPYLNGEQSL